MKKMRLRVPLKMSCFENIYIKRTSRTHVYIYTVSFNSTANQAQHKKHPNNLGIARGVVAKKPKNPVFREAFTGLFADFSWAIAQGKGLVPRSLAKMMKL